MSKSGAGEDELSSEELRLTLDCLCEGLQVLSPEWRYLYVNDAAARHGRRSKGELLGKTLLESYPGVERTHLFAELQRCLSQRQSARFENEFVFADGTRGWFEIWIQPCRQGLTVLSLDVTERKQLELELRRHEKLRALGQMAAGIAHDLKNILNPLALHLELLKRRLNADRSCLQVLEQMRRVLERGTQTIDLLRDFGRISPTFLGAPIELDSIAEEAVELCRLRATERGSSLILEGDSRALVRVHASELLSAVVNLIVNAIDAVTIEGQVRVRTGRADEGAWLEVEDNGIGMPKEVEARAFEPFFSTKGDAGIGLGLAMVYALATRYAGQVRLLTAPGQGTTVRLLFPCVDGSASEADVDASGGGGR